MKSRIILSFMQFLVLICLVFCLTSCKTNNYQVTYLIHTFSDLKTNDVTLLKSKNELNDYLKEPIFSNANNNVIEKLESYSNDYFNNNTLIIINLYEISSSNKLIVKNVKLENSKATVLIKREIQNINSDDIQVWSIIVEINNKNIDLVEYEIS